MLTTEEKEVDAQAEKTYALQEINDHVSNETKQDDWRPPMDHCEYNLQVPSFIRLFCIRRILYEYIIDNINTEIGSTTAKVIANLVSVFNDNAEEIKTRASDIVTRLINHGIKIYMEKWYNEKEDSNVI